MRSRPVFLAFDLHRLTGRATSVARTLSHDDSAGPISHGCFHPHVPRKRLWNHFLGGAQKKERKKNKTAAERLPRLESPGVVR
jgi:hypothetical protein